MAQLRTQHTVDEMFERIDSLNEGELVGSFLSSMGAQNVLSELMERGATVESVAQLQRELAIGIAAMKRAAFMQGWPLPYVEMVQGRPEVH